jgi:hypothetical protein
MTTLTPEQIINGNKNIATFMGGVFKTDLPYTFTKSGWVNTPANDSKEIAQDYDLIYHSNWEWLMPVVDKIQSLRNKCNNVKLEYGLTLINAIETWFKYTHKRISKKEAVWLACVEFIEWYNKQENL